MAADIRKSGIDVLGDLPWGEHFCLFYETKGDLLEAVVPYFKAGFDNNEFCMWAVSQPLTVAEAGAAFFLMRHAPSAIRLIPLIVSCDMAAPGRLASSARNRISEIRRTASHFKIRGGPR